MLFKEFPNIFAFKLSGFGDIFGVIQSLFIAFKLPELVIGQDMLIMSPLRESDVGVILAEVEPVFGAAGKESVWFGDLLGNEVVEHDADIAQIAWQFHRIHICGESCGVESGDQALTGGLLIAAGAVDLTSGEQVGVDFILTCPVHLVGENEVILDCVGVPGDDGVFETWNSSEHHLLNAWRQAGGYAVKVVLISIFAFWFKVQEVAFVMSETDDFIFK